MICRTIPGKDKGRASSRSDWADAVAKQKECRQDVCDADASNGPGRMTSLGNTLNRLNVQVVFGHAIGAAGKTRRLGQISTPRRFVL